MTDLRERFAGALGEAARRLGAEPPEVVVEPSALASAGDLSSPLAFRLASQLRRPPRQIAEQLTAAMEADRPPHTSELSVSGGGYVNLRIDYSTYAPEVIAAALELSPVISPDPSAGVKVVVEHTATNPNKAAHVGHLRNACIGDTVARLLRACGHPVEVQNYIDDTGVQVADVLVGLRELGLEAHQGEPFDRFCSRAYAEVCRRYEDQPELLERRREVLQEIESRKGEVAQAARALTGKIVDAHLRTMARAGISYDLLTWESDIIERGFLGRALDLMRESAVIRKVTTGPLAGCWVLPNQAGEEDAEPELGEAKVLIKSDGIATYTAKDIANHLWKFGLLGLDFEYFTLEGDLSTWAEALSTPEAGSQHPSGSGRHTVASTHPGGLSIYPARFGHAGRVVNVIDQRQSVPQRVVREALSRLGHESQAEALQHLAYEVVALSPAAASALGLDTSSGKAMYALSGRKGIEIAADDLLDEAQRQVQVKSQDPTTAAQLASSAVRYYLLRFGLNSIISFDFAEALRTSGDTGVYLQYAHARACGVLNRVPPLPVPARAGELGPEERELVKALADFPRTVAEAASALSPSALASYTFSLATTFNDMYEHTERLYQVQDPGIRGLRRGLVDASRATLARALELMGMTPLARI